MIRKKRVRGGHVPVHMMMMMMLRSKNSQVILTFVGAANKPAATLKLSFMSYLHKIRAQKCDIFYSIYVIPTTTQSPKCQRRSTTTHAYRYSIAQSNLTCMAHSRSRLKSQDKRLLAAYTMYVPPSGSKKMIII
jgi:hypothetical protein